MDSIRSNWLMALNIAQKRHLLLVGPTGTGKTVNVVNDLNRFMANAASTSTRRSPT